MTAEEFETKLTEMIKLGKELGYEVGILLDTRSGQENIEGIIMGSSDFVQTSIQYMQLDRLMASSVEEAKKTQKPTHTPTKTNTDDNGDSGNQGGPTWH